MYSDSDSESESDVLNDDASEKTEEMVVYSEHLINALHSVRRCVVEMDVFKKSAKIKAPFRGLMRSYQALRLYRIAQPQCHSKDYATTTVKHIDVLLGFLEENYSSKLAGPSVGHQQKTPVVEFHWLSDIFRPGEVVYCRGYNDWKPAIIQDVQRVVTDQHDKLQITCWNVTFFLGRMIKLYHRFSIMFFAGEQSIYTLDVIPAGCFRSNTDKANNQDVADRKHILMGRLYWELVKQPTYKECSGELFSDAPMKTPCGRVNNYSLKQTFHMGTSYADQVLGYGSSHSRCVGGRVAWRHGVIHDAVLQSWSSDSNRSRSQTTSAWHNWSTKSIHSAAPIYLALRM